MLPNKIVRMKSVLLLLVAIVCFNPINIFAEVPRIKVGAILILTGANSEYGVQARRGAQVAIDEINNLGGVNQKQFEFIWEDETSGKAERTVAAYKKLTVVDKVDYIFGPSFQDGLLAIAPMARKDNILLLTPSTPSLSLPNVFSTWIDPHIEADIVAEHMLKKFKKISVLAAQQSWELMVADAFKKKVIELGGVISSYADPLNTSTDLKPEVLRVRESQPDAVFISSYTLFPYYVKELRRQGVSVPIFTIEADNAGIQAGGVEAEGVVSIGPSIPETDFTKKYLVKFGVLPDIPSYQAYDAVKMLAEAIKANGEGTENALKFFKLFKQFDGASGVMTNVNGIVSTSTAFFVVQNGKLERLDS